MQLLIHCIQILSLLPHGELKHLHLLIWMMDRWMDEPVVLSISSPQHPQAKFFVKNVMWRSAKQPNANTAFSQIGKLCYIINS